MGEYGTYNGQEIKIGTCEDMYYLRPDQVHMVKSDTLRDLTSIRFRFPFPDEDGKAPGDFENYGRGVGVYGWEDVLSKFDHYKVQFVASVGYNVMLPCPQSSDGAVLAKAAGLTFHRNGFSGPVKIKQQRVWAGVWVTVIGCGACDALIRLPELSDAQPLIDVIRERYVKPNEERDPSRAKWWLTIADRIERGYSTPAPERGALS